MFELEADVPTLAKQTLEPVFEQALNIDGVVTISADFDDDHEEAIKYAEENTEQLTS